MVEGAFQERRAGRGALAQQAVNGFNTSTHCVSLLFWYWNYQKNHQSGNEQGMNRVLF